MSEEDRTTFTTSLLNEAPTQAQIRALGQNMNAYFPNGFQAAGGWSSTTLNAALKLTPHQIQMLAEDQDFLGTNDPIGKKFVMDSKSSNLPKVSTDPNAPIPVPDDFDAENYLLIYPDLRKAYQRLTGNALLRQAEQHYVNRGGKTENRSYLVTPGLPADFNVDKYLENYKDLRDEADRQKLTGKARLRWAEHHYRKHGSKENRSYR